VDKVWKAADAVIELIHTEVQERNRPLGDWQPVSAATPAQRPGH
jgi:hypothetical protein